MKHALQVLLGEYWVFIDRNKHAIHAHEWVFANRQVNIRCILMHNNIEQVMENVRIVDRIHRSSIQHLARKVLWIKSCA